MRVSRLLKHATMVIAAVVPRDMWRLYVLLVIANELDLVFTYMGLAAGTFVEANPLMAPLLLTYWPIAMKLFPLVGLSLALCVIPEIEPHRQRRAYGALSAAAGVYAIVLILHVVNVLVASLPG